MHPLAAAFITAATPHLARAAGPLAERAGHALIDVFSHSAKTMTTAYGNLLNAVADRIRGPATPQTPSNH